MTHDPCQNHQCCTIEVQGMAESSPWWVEGFCRYIMTSGFTDVFGEMLGMVPDNHIDRLQLMADGIMTEAEIDEWMAADQPPAADRVGDLLGLYREQRQAQDEPHPEDWERRHGG